MTFAANVNSRRIRMHHPQVRIFGVQSPLQFPSLSPAQLSFFQPLEGGQLTLCHVILSLLLSWSTLGSVGGYLHNLSGGVERDLFQAYRPPPFHGSLATEIRLCVGHVGSKALSIIAAERELPYPDSPGHPK
jgi:hypothetical protein